MRLNWILNLFELVQAGSVNVFDTFCWIWGVRVPKHLICLFHFYCDRYARQLDDQLHVAMNL